MSKSIAVLGGPNTGKSHFAIQLFGRLRTKKGAISLRQAPESTSLFQAGLERLNQGIAAIHTSTDTYLECMLPLSCGGRDIDITWPDYDGEQLHRLVTKRQINQEWQDRVSSADAWLLFVRLGIMPQHKDILSAPIDTDIPAADDVETTELNAEAVIDELTGQAKVIELLQILLNAANIDISSPTLKPKIGVVLSCWDEVCDKPNVVPESLLGDKAPLIYQFLESNWVNESQFVMGLSSTGKPLDQNKPDEDFKKRGPEEFGFSIDTDGSQVDDLTLPISKLLELTETHES
ncbi:hypothetical protein DTL42_11710 [Bremerella cremea]|uniref:Double-GTPase 1 domain-containing protein n=1 Tax=Bremerella cremea TaxID=1031537 RepID=A0A368KTD4_9BACT|nr:hypothetical protein [Bremerella cremea]RCS49199.1 hypothetical protein DTL42_11710 [Bremerella cremea]